MILKNMSFALLLCGGLLLMGSAAQAESVKTPVNKISPDGVGEEIGFITFSDADGGGVDIIVDLTGLPEGEHGMHVHENASCAPAEKDGKMVAGLAAGGHYDPMKTNKHAGPARPAIRATCRISWPMPKAWPRPSCTLPTSRPRTSRAIP